MAWPTKWYGRAAPWQLPAAAAQLVACDILTQDLSADAKYILSVMPGPCASNVFVHYNAARDTFLGYRIYKLWKKMYIPDNIEIIFFFKQTFAYPLAVNNVKL